MHLLNYRSQGGLSRGSFYSYHPNAQVLDDHICTIFAFGAYPFFHVDSAVFSDVLKKEHPLLRLKDPQQEEVVQEDRRGYFFSFFSCLRSLLPWFRG